MVSSVVLSNHSDVPVDNEATNITAPASPANFLLASVHREDVANYSHVSNDLIIQFKNGRTLQIKGFFTTHEIANNLVFEEDNQLILVEFHNAMSGAGDGIVEASVIYEPIEDGLATTALLGLLGAAAIGLAAGGGGGGGGSPSTPPAPPSLTISGNGKPVADGHATNDNTPNLSGTAKPGSTVTIYDNGQAIGSTTADGNGNWSYTPTQPLTEGSHSLTATATDSTGSSSPSPAQTVGVDTQPPSAPNIGTVTDNAGTATGSIVAGGTTDDATPTLSGTAEPGSTVSIYDGSTLLGTTTAGPDGIWTFTPFPPLTDGSHQLTATATDAAGNPSGPSASFGLTVDTTPPAAPVATISDPNGDNIPTASGTTEPGSTVTVTWPDGSTSTTTADPVTGQWTVDAPTVQPSGTVSAVATDPAGNTSSGTGTWTADTTAPDTTTVGTTVTVTSVAGDNVVNATESTSTSVPVTVALVNVPADAATTTVTVVVGIASYVATQNPDGTWTALVSGTDLVGATSVTANATFTDAAGNTSAPVSGSLGYMVDTTAPTTNVTLTDPEGDNRPTASGSTEPGSTVTVTWPDGSTTEVVANASTGDWVATAPTTQTDGLVTATVTDPAGNEGSGSGTWTSTAATIGGATSGTGAEDSATPITGTLTATDPDGLTDGTIFSVTGSATNGTASIDPATGAWSYTPNANFSGSDTFTVTVTDDQGFTTTQVITVDVTPVNDAPVAVADTATTTEDTPLTVDAASGLLANDTDVDNTAAQLTVTAGTFTTTQGGSITIAADGSYTYTPPANYSGPDSVNYTVSDGTLTSSSTLTITVDPLDAVADVATLNTGNTTATVGAPVTTDNVQVLGLLESSDPVDPNPDASQTVIIDGDYSVLHVEVSQQALVAVADGYRVDIVDATGKVIASTNPNDPNLVGQVLTPIIGGTLGVSGSNTLTVDFLGLPAGTYSVVVHNNPDQLTALLDSDGSGGVSLQELGDNGVILGANNEALIVDTVVDALNGGLLGLPLGLGDLARPILTLALDGIIAPVGQQTPVSALVGILGDVLSDPLLGLTPLQVTDAVDSLVSTLATTLLTNTLTLLQTTTVTTQLTEYAFVGTAPLAGNVINDADPAGNDTLGSVGTTAVTYISHGGTPPVAVDAVNGTDIVGSYGTLHINANGSYTYTANGNPLSAGNSDVFTYTLADGAASDTATLTINLVDTAAPTQIPTITAISGEPAGDWTTTDASPTLLGTLNAPLLPGEKVQVQIDGGAWVDAYMDPNDTNGADGWTWFYGSSDLTGGSHTVNVRVVDQSGNVGLNTDSQPIVIDTANQAPVAVVNQGILGSLIGADLLGLVDLGNQTFVAYDPNNNLQSVSVSYQVPLDLSTGFDLAASNQIAAELGLQFSVVHVNYNINNPLNLFDDTFPSSTLTITAIGGGPIDNLAVNELLRSVHLTANLNLGVAPTYSITTTDMNGLTVTDSATTLVDLGLFGSSGDPTVIQGTAIDNTVMGTSADEHLYGFAGNDILRGGDGNDLLRGGSGIDQLYGEDGNDTLVYDAADTVIDGGLGNDTLLITAGTASLLGASTPVHDIETILLGTDTTAVTLNLDADAAAKISFASSPILIHGNGSDTVNLTDGIYGGQVLSNGQAYAQYTLGGTTVLVDPEVAVRNSVTGTSGNDVLYVSGEAGSDALTGNGGNDVFLWDSLNPANATGGNGTDTITDFTIGVVGTSANADVLDLSQLLTGYTPDADGPAHYVGGVATIDAGDNIGQFLSVANVGGNTVISIDRDGVGTAYQSTPLVTLSGVTTDLATLLANHQVIV